IDSTLVARLRVDVLPPSTTETMGSSRSRGATRLTLGVARLVSGGGAGGGRPMRDCTCWCGFRRVASRRVLWRFAYPCDLGVTQRRRGVRQTDARLLAVAAARI